jgi:hypothetical protein
MKPPTGHCAHTPKSTKVIQMKTLRNRNLRYCIALHVSMIRNRLQPAVRRKHHVLWYSGVCPQHDMDRCLTGRRAAKQILDLKQEALNPSAIFARFGTRQFSLLRHLKESLRARHFRSDEEVNEAVHDWLAQQTVDFYSRGI